jgi:hypothetical protein
MNPGGGMGPGGSAGINGQSGGAGGQSTGTGSGGGTQAFGTGGAAAGASSTGGAGTDCCTAKSCQTDAVQACVCTQWQQADCCSGEWTTFCQTTAEQKCQARHCLPDPTPTDDGGTIEKGACCATHSTGGCADMAVETCICALLPDCCSKAWDSVCVQLVREKHCEDGVRKCVCETWQQASCCDTQWTDVCGIVAEDKCGAAPSCP